MKKLYFLDYSFLVEHGTYISVAEFEKDLADFLASKKIHAQYIQSVGGAEGKRIFLLTKAEEPKIEESKVKVKPKSVKSQFDKFRK